MVKSRCAKSTSNTEEAQTKTIAKHKTRSSAAQAVAGDRDLMKAPMKQALQEVLEGKMTEFLGAAHATTRSRLIVMRSWFHRKHGHKRHRRFVGLRVVAQTFIGRRTRWQPGLFKRVREGLRNPRH